MKNASIGIAAGAALAGAIALAAIVAVTRTVMIPAAVESTALPPPPPVDSMTVARRLSQAITFKTVTYGEGVRRAERTAALRDMYLWMERTYRYFHEDAPQEIFGESVIYVWRGTDDNLAPVLLVAHLDVAPVAEGTESQWTHQPFSGDLADGYVWGRGTIDNKSAAIAMMEAGDRLAQSNFQPRRTIMFAFGEDHEAGGANGNGAIAKALMDRGVRLAWVLDEGSPILKEPYPGIARPVALVSVAEKGLLRLELAAKGDVPQERLNRAVDSALRRSFASDLDPIQRAKLDVLTPLAPFGERMKLANLWLTKPLVLRTMESSIASGDPVRTTAVRVTPASVQENASASDALAVVDVFLHPRDTASAVTEQMKAAIGDSNVEVRSVMQVEPSRTADINGPAYAYISRAVAETFQIPVAPEMMTRPTDSRYYLDIADAVLRFSPFSAAPDDLVRVHGADERIAISDLGPAVGFYTWLIRNSAQ